MCENTFGQITFYDFAGQVIYSTLPFSQNITPETAFQTLSFKDINSSKRTLDNQRNLDVVGIPFSEILGAFEVRNNHELAVFGVALKSQRCCPNVYNFALAHLFTDSDSQFPYYSCRNQSCKSNNQAFDPISAGVLEGS